MARLNKPSTKIRANLKKNTSKDDFIDGLWTLGLMPITYLAIPAFLKKYVWEGFGEGWSGLATAWATTFFAGAAFDIKTLTYGSFAATGVHIVMAKGQGLMDDIGLPVWRMGGDYSTPALISPETQTTANGMGYLEPGSSILSSPLGYDYMTRTGLEAYVAGAGANQLNAYVADAGGDGSALSAYVAEYGGSGLNSYVNEATANQPVNTAPINYMTNSNAGLGAMPGEYTGRNNNRSRFANRR